jgi:hypothetical protein
MIFKLFFWHWRHKPLWQEFETWMRAENPVKTPSGPPSLRSSIVLATLKTYVAKLTRVLLPARNRLLR